jgi:hypothetical protein
MKKSGKSGTTIPQSSEAVQIGRPRSVDGGRREKISANLSTEEFNSADLLASALGISYGALVRKGLKKLGVKIS